MDLTTPGGACGGTTTVIIIIIILELLKQLSRGYAQRRAHHRPLDAASLLNHHQSFSTKKIWAHTALHCGVMARLGGELCSNRPLDRSCVSPGTGETRTASQWRRRPPLPRDWSLAREVE